MINRVRSRMALRRHEKQRQQLRPYDTARVPAVGFLLIVGALLFIGLIGLSTWFEPAITDAAAKLRLRRRPPRSWRRRRASSAANDGWGASRGGLRVRWSPLRRQPVARASSTSARCLRRRDRLQCAFLLGIRLGAIASSPQT